MGFADFRKHFCTPPERKKLRNENTEYRDHAKGKGVRLLSKRIIRIRS